MLPNGSEKWEPKGSATKALKLARGQLEPPETSSRFLLESAPFPLHTGGIWQMSRDWGKGQRKRVNKQKARGLWLRAGAKREGHREGGMGPTTRTYMLLCDAADVPDVHDLPLVAHHAHCDGVLAHLGGDVAVHLNSQVLQHQKPCASQRKAWSQGLLPSTLVWLGGGALWPAGHVGQQ